MKMNYKILFIYIVLFSAFVSCTKEDDLNYEKREIEVVKGEINAYLKENFLDKYNSAVRWEWNDIFVDVNYYVGPCKSELVIPTGEFMKDFWIEPYAMCSEKGKKFIEDNFPTEVVLIGTKMLNENGTTTLGFAEAGVRITLTEINDFDLKSDAWMQQQLHTIHHEFTHIVHQTYQLPLGYEKISGGLYTGNSWTTLIPQQRQLSREELEAETEEEYNKRHNAKKDNSNAIKRGIVTPYGSSNEYEDFAELVSFFLITKAEDFNEEYKPKTDEEIEKAVSDTINNFFVKLEKIQVEAYDLAYATAYASNYSYYLDKYKEEGQSEAEAKLAAAEIANKNAVALGNKSAAAAKLKMPEISEITEPMFEKAKRKAMADGKTEEEAEIIAFNLTAPYVNDMTFISVQRGLLASENLKSLNEGKQLIQKKLDLTKDYYKANFDVDLSKLRDILQERIANAKK